MLIGVIILAVVFYLTTPVEQKEYTYSEIETLFREEKVKSFSLEGDELTLNLYSADSDGNTTIKKTLPNPNWFREDLGDLIDEQTASGVLTEYDYVKGWTAPWWMSILPYLITVVLFIGVWYLLMNKSGGGGAPGVGKFGKAHTRTGEENLKKAVAGGINKINVCTDAFQAGKEGMLALLEENPKADFLALQMAAEASIKKFVKDYMHIIGSNGRYTYAEYESGSKE